MKQKILPEWKQRYCAAHKSNFARTRPIAFADGLYPGCEIPKIKTANGLTKFICNFLLWSNCHATRVSSAGRLIDGVEKTESGLLLSTKKWIPSTTRKGTADVRAIIKGRAVDIEIKIGSDRPSPFQLREQELIRNAGGFFEFIKTPKEFFALYDKILSL